MGYVIEQHKGNKQTNTHKQIQLHREKAKKATTNAGEAY